MIQRIKDNPGRSVSIDQIAQELNFSRSHFCRLFRSETGMSFNEFLTKTRITKACDTTVRKAVVEGLAGLPNFTKAQKWLPRGCEVSAAVEAEARLCNSRNVDRYRALVRAGKRPNVAKVAVASELVRQMWVLGNIVRGESREG